MATKLDEEGQHHELARDGGPEGEGSDGAEERSGIPLTRKTAFRILSSCKSKFLSIRASEDCDVEVEALVAESAP